MKKSIFLLSILAMNVLVGCNEKTAKESRTDSAGAKKTMENGLMVPETWIRSRVGKAEEKLNTTEVGTVVWNAMEARGGLARWYSNGALAFRFNYQPLDGSTQRDSYQTIDTWSNRARHTSAADSTAHFGWTGEKAWIQAKDSTAFAYDTRFWALTPYYFLAQPFVLDGEGVNLELLSQITYKGKVQDVVKVTFDSGTGDAPDDYYVLYFTKDTHRLSAIRYIVSYPGYFKKGEHLPEKFMEVIGENIVNGILFPTDYKTYWLTENQKPGEYITKIEVSDVHFIDTLKNVFFDMPEDAENLEDQ